MLDGMLEDTQVPPLEGVSQKLDSFYRDLLAAWACRHQLQLLCDSEVKYFF